MTPPLPPRRSRHFPPIMAPRRGTSRLRPGPLLSLGLGQSPSSGMGPRPLRTGKVGPRSRRLLAFSTSSRCPDSAGSQTDKPPRAHLPQPLVARPLSAPRGCPSAGNLTPAPLPSQLVASAQREEPKSEGQAARAVAAKWTLTLSSRRGNRSGSCPQRKRKRPPQPSTARGGVRELARTAHAHAHAHAHRETQSPADNQHASLGRVVAGTRLRLRFVWTGRGRGLGPCHSGCGADRKLQMGRRPTGRGVASPQE